MTERRSRYDAEWEQAPAGYDAREGGQGPYDAQPRSGGGILSPGLIFLVIAIVGSIVYMAFVISVRDSSQIPLMASGAVVLAIVFAASAVYALRATLRAGQEPGGGGRSVLIAIVGGIAAIAAAGFAAGAIILFQIGSWRP